MCGIAGEIRWNPTSDSGWDPFPNTDSDEAARAGASSDERTVQRMLDAMAPRGPDDSGIYHDSQVTLGCCRLAIVGVEGGRQPMTTPDGRYTIVYNGECYELRQLREQLRAVGVQFRTGSDTEVVLHAFARLGPAALDRLNGMFAMAIWDRQRRQLFLARDRFGIKPLYYATLKDRLVFASTLDALAARGDVSTELDPQAVNLLLATRFIPAPLTIYRQAKKLPAGHCAVARAGYFQQSAWWDLPLQGPATRPTSLRNSVDRVDELLRRATLACLESERPLGLCLSGGIDSGLLASYLPRGSARTFSLGLPTPDYDESDAAFRTAAHLGLHHTRVPCAHDVDGLLQRVVNHLDEPLADSSSLAMLALAEGLRDAVTVVLSGSGGDELFGGYRRHAAILMSRRLGHLPGSLNVMRVLSGRSGNQRGTALHRFAGAAATDPLDCFLRWIAPTSPDIGLQLRSSPAVAWDAAEQTRELFRAHYDRAAHLPLVNRLSYLELKTVLVDDYLVKEDRMTMGCSLEGRFPMLDHRLAELAFALPPRYKLRWLQTKRGFEVPLAQWLRGPLMPRLHDTLLAPSAAIHAYCDPRVIQRVSQQHAAGADHSRLLYCLLMLETWLGARRPARPSQPATTIAVLATSPMFGPSHPVAAVDTVADSQPPTQHRLP
jgi:asparagine synthase (glutamine-hydrolysing)